MTEEKTNEVLSAMTEYYFNKSDNYYVINTRTNEIINNFDNLNDAKILAFDYAINKHIPTIITKEIAIERLELTSYDNWLFPRTKFDTKTKEIINEDGTKEQII